MFWAYVQERPEKAPSSLLPLSELETLHKDVKAKAEMLTASWVLKTSTEWGRIWVAWHTYSSWGWARRYNSSSSWTVKSVLFSIYLEQRFFFSSCTFCWNFRIYNGPSRVLKFCLLMSLMEKMCVLYNLRSGTSYSAVGCEFSVSESTI